MGVPPRDGLQPLYSPQSWEMVEERDKILLKVEIFCLCRVCHRFFWCWISLFLMLNLVIFAAKILSSYKFGSKWRRGCLPVSSWSPVFCTKVLGESVVRGKKYARDVCGNSGKLIVDLCRFPFPGPMVAGSICPFLEDLGRTGSITSQSSIVGSHGHSWSLAFISS